MIGVLRVVRVAAIVYCSLMFLAIVGISVWCIWHTGSRYDNPESRVVDTWVAVGLVPGFVLAVIACVPLRSAT